MIVEDDSIIPITLDTENKVAFISAKATKKKTRLAVYVFNMFPNLIKITFQGALPITLYKERLPEFPGVIQTENGSFAFG